LRGRIWIIAWRRRDAGHRLVELCPKKKSAAAMTTALSVSPAKHGGLGGMGLAGRGDNDAVVRIVPSIKKLAARTEQVRPLNVVRLGDSRRA
jgi:hypothetical protein